MEREESFRNDATSKETVDDLEENEFPEDKGNDDVPSPDGAFDEPAEQKDADPI